MSTYSDLLLFRKGRIKRQALGISERENFLVALNVRLDRGAIRAD
jgi:hypothetical protein